MSNALTNKELCSKLSGFKSTARVYYLEPNESEDIKKYITRIYGGNAMNDATGLIFDLESENAMVNSNIQTALKSMRANMPVGFVIAQQDFDIYLLVSDVFEDKNGDLKLEFEVEK